MARKRHQAFLDDSTNLDAKFTAQRLAFGPMMFQAARCLRDMGILEALKKRGTAGLSEAELAESTAVSVYGLRVLLEAGLVGGLVALEDDRWVLTKVGYLVLVDPMTRANMDFMHDVCYRPAFHLEASVREGRPVGLQELGPWKTVYEGLSQLPEQVRRSWFAFDHYYSDGVFGELLPIVFDPRPRTILDVGGNTGKFARECLRYDEEVGITIVDLPGQLNEALAAIEAEGFSGRVRGIDADILDPSSSLPDGHDVIWMSQFLDCFSEEQIVAILEKAAAVMTPDTRLYILETLWDLQRHEASRYSVVQTSLYFTCVANGDSKMYHSERLRACIERAGLRVEAMTEDIGVAHTLLHCGLRAPS